jgi:hypothetical protein
LLSIKARTSSSSVMAGCYGAIVAVRRKQGGILAALSVGAGGLGGRVTVIRSFPKYEKRWSLL